MPKLVRSRVFIKEFAKTRISDTQWEKFLRYTTLLMDGGPLPAASKDHMLKGNWQGHREFHLGGDLLVIYRITPDAVELVRIGTHSQLFE
jgi:mRNA interferase YafQ